MLSISRLSFGEGAISFTIAAEAKKSPELSGRVFILIRCRIVLML